MSILIPGMEMPTSCDVCPFNVFKICLINTLQEGKYTVTHSCPLVPVPEHGRLIDADALEKDIDKYIGGEESRSRFHHWVQVQRTVISESEESCT